MTISNSDVNKVCDEIHSLVQMSGLHFVINQTPWSSYITIRRKLVSPGACNVKVKSPETVVINELKERKEQLEHKLAHVEFTLAEIEEAFNKEKEKYKKSVDNLQSKIDALEKEKESKDAIIQNINAHFNSKVFELNSKVEKLETFKKDTRKTENKALKKHKQKLLKDANKNKNDDAGVKDENKNVPSNGVPRSEIKSGTSNDLSAFSEPSSPLCHLSPPKMIPVPSTPPPRGCSPARGPPATPLSPNTPPGLPPLLQGNPSPNLSCYFTNTANSALLQASTKPDEPLITTEYIKNISKFSLVPRQKETKTS